MMIRCKRLNRLVLLSSVLIRAVAAHAATYFVATTGNDSNSCAQAQTANTAKLTIAAGVKCLSGGDTLILKAGTYTHQEITNPPAGTASAYTVIKGDPSGPRPVLLPNKAATQRGLYCSRGETCKYIEMRYLEVRDAYNVVKLHGDDKVGYAHHMRFIDNYFYGGGIGMLFASSFRGYAGGDHLIRGNVFEKIGRLTPGYHPGVNSIYNPGSRTVIENNTFRHCHIGVGIWSSLEGTRATAKWIRDVIIRNNIFHDLARYSLNTWEQGMGPPRAIHISVPGGGHLIYNNIVYRSGDRDPLRHTPFQAITIDTGVAGPISIPIGIYNNTFYNFLRPDANTVHIATGSCNPPMCFIRNNIAYLTGGIVGGTQSNNLLTDPMFANAAGADFRLKSGSPAIDKGTNVSPVVTSDFAGASRPFGGVYDIGAFEFGASMPNNLTPASPSNFEVK